MLIQHLQKTGVYLFYLKVWIFPNSFTCTNLILDQRIINCLHACLQFHIHNISMIQFNGKLYDHTASYVQLTNSVQLINLIGSMNLTVNKCHEA